MLLRINASGSKGNNYVLEHNGQLLLLDAGINISDIKKGIDFRVGDIVGCLITHKHL